MKTSLSGMLTKSALEEALALHIRVNKLPEPEREIRLHPTRRWRVDFVWRYASVVAECEGATWSGGRHTRGAGFESDCEKYNALTLMGFRVYRFTRGMVTSGAAIETLQRALLTKIPGLS